GSNIIKAFCDSEKIIKTITESKVSLMKAETDSTNLSICSSDQSLSEELLPIDDFNTEEVAINAESNLNTEILSKRISCLTHIFNSSLKAVLEKSPIASTKASILELLK
ncbi:MAG: hypothetical protein MHPSP_004714, partial [Paramarteilia canceri]